jgi:hypothetical protein
MKWITMGSRNTNFWNVYLDYIQIGKDAQKTTTKNKQANFDLNARSIEMPFNDY